MVYLRLWAAKFGRPEGKVIAIAGDGSFQMSMQELGTIKQNKLGVKIIIFNNSRLGMVREIQKIRYCSRYSQFLEENPDFVKLADAYGFKGESITNNQKLEVHWKECFPDDEPYLLECTVDPEEGTFIIVMLIEGGLQMAKHTLSVLVENHAGVLSRVSGLFSRRGFNIDSLAVGVTENPEISRMTIVVDGDEYTVEQVSKQLNKLIDVIKIKQLDKSDSVSRDLALIKVNATASTRAEIIQIVEIFRAKIVDVSKNTLTIEISGGND